MWRIPLKILLKTIFFGALFLVCVLTIEGILFYRILIAPNKVAEADVIVVFMGAGNRVSKGHHLADSGLAPYLILSPATGSRLLGFHQQHGARTKSYAYLVEDRATTTFQNALLTGRLIKQQGFKSCLLVTDQYHMPRSLLLLKIALVGRGVTIVPAPVDPGSIARSPLEWTTRQKKILYNEMIKFWGSLTELTHYHATGRLPERDLGDGKIVSFLRSVLLFQIE
jgi:uncharacterized SAM-binding protein YcdF (DUF218 family)